MPHPVLRFDHVAITVRDMDRTVGFYRDLLELVSGVPDVAAYGPGWG